MRIVVTGLRGFPNIQGGIETHCEELCPRLARLGCDITVVRRKKFIRETPRLSDYEGVKFKDINSPQIKGLEAALHTVYGVLYAHRVKADIIHIHAIGPAIAIPIAKMLGLKVIVTHHGPDYNREKWGLIARSILKLGEYFTARYADEIISISTIITNILQQKYKRTENVHLIFNGITKLPASDSTDFLKRLALEPDRYILAVGRFVEEKRFDQLIEAFIKLKDDNYKLVIAGGSDYASDYACSLKNMAMENDVILTGVVKGKQLYELYKNAALFVLPSSHEGLPITLLEAIYYGKRVLASNISANLVVNLPKKCYFELGNLKDLTTKMREALQDKSVLNYDMSQYNWDNISKQVFAIYKKMLAT